MHKEYDCLGFEKVLTGNLGRLISLHSAGLRGTSNATTYSEKT